MLSMFSFDVSTTRHKPLIFTTYVYCLLHHCTHTKYTIQYTLSTKKQLVSSTFVIYFAATKAAFAKKRCQKYVYSMNPD